MRKLILLAALLLPAFASAQTVGAAVPSTATVLAGKSGLANTVVSVTVCDRYAPISANALNGGVHIIGQDGAKDLYICGLFLSSSSNQTVSLEQVDEADTNCTGGTPVIGGLPLAAASGLVLSLSPFGVKFMAGGYDLCLKANGGGNVRGWISYAQR
jgi:hypothetical protein